MGYLTGVDNINTPINEALLPDIWLREKKQPIKTEKNDVNAAIRNIKLKA